MAEEEVVTTEVTGDVETPEVETTEEVVEEVTEEVTEGSTDSTEESEGEAVAAEPQGVLRVKIDGQEKDFDLTNADHIAEVTKLVAHAGAANKRMQEATQMQQQSVEFIKMLKQNPLAVLTNPALGIDNAQLREAVESYLIEQIRLDEMDEGTRTAYNKAKDYDRLLEQQKYAQQQQAEQANYQLAVQIKGEIENSIMESGLPLNETTFEQVRALMFAAANDGRQLEAGDAVKQLTGAIRTMIEQGKDEQLVAILGEDNVKRVQKKKAPQEKVVPKEQQGEVRQKEKKTAKKMTVAEFRASLGI